MIISHKHRFIFIKTFKTAGTSTEIALNKICGKNDIFTHIPSDFGEGHDGQNAEGFRNHISAIEIKERIGDDVWNSYFKFAFERNPWDKVVSWYWYLQKKRNHNQSFEEFCIKSFLSGPDDFHEGYWSRARWKRAYWWFSRNPVGKYGIRDMISRRYLRKEYFTYLPLDYPRYTINDELAVDFVGRYENLTSDLEKIFERLNIQENPKLGREKTEARKDTRTYTEMYDDTTRAIIAEGFKKEIALLDYRFGV